MDVQPAIDLLRLGATGESFGSPVLFVALMLKAAASGTRRVTR
jgi:hypothetical protein